MFCCLSPHFYHFANSVYPDHQQLRAVHGADQDLHWLVCSLFYNINKLDFISRLASIDLPQVTIKKQSLTFSKLASVKFNPCSR